jgi:hypothetical protein
MPCGGIYPVENAFSSAVEQCWQCSKPILPTEDASFCEEWDTFLHDRCIDAFLKSEEGEIVLLHKHEVERR